MPSWRDHPNAPAQGSVLCAVADIPEGSGFEVMYGEGIKKLRVVAFRDGETVLRRFDPAVDTTLAILAGFKFNRRVMIQGYHGTGKSTHIEQVAARLNWPCIRINLDSHVSRIDLDRQGRDRAARTASRSPSSAKASCPGRCSAPSRWCSTNTTPAGRT
jgi:hypothetical protein